MVYSIPAAQRTLLGFVGFFEAAFVLQFSVGTEIPRHETRNMCKYVIFQVAPKSCLFPQTGRIGCNAEIVSPKRENLDVSGTGLDRCGLRVREVEECDKSKGHLMRLGMKTFALAIAATLMAPTAFADGHGGDGDAAKGEKTFKKCKACHKIGEGAKNGTGPHLNDVIGRTAGSLEDYKFSESMVAAGEAGLVWDAENMFEYLKDPKKYLQAFLDDKAAKSKMTLKLKKEDDRKNVIAYVATFSAAPSE